MLIQNATRLLVKKKKKKSNLYCKKIHTLITFGYEYTTRSNE